MRMIMRVLLCPALFGPILIARAQAQPVPAPHVHPGDTWVFQHTVENRTGWHQTHVESTVDHAGPGGIALESKPVHSTLPPMETLVGPDWSRVRSVNGHSTVVNRPLAFPLAIGKTWVIDYTEDHPNRLHSSEHFHTPYRVTGWEDVTVPAGTFHALKIEADGEWFAAIAPAVGAVAGSRVDAEGATTVLRTSKVAPRTISGRTYKAFWYVPAVKLWVKNLEEYYNAGGVRTERYTDELESYKVAD